MTIIHVYEQNFIKQTTSVNENVGVTRIWRRKKQVNKGLVVLYVAHL